MNHDNNTTTRSREKFDTTFAGSSEEIHIDTMVFSLLEEQKRIDSKYLYDETGSRLFRQICRLGEYYPSRNGLQILKQKILPALPSYKDVQVIEMGTGESMKTRTLIRFLHMNACRDIHYIPVDFSRVAIRTSSLVVRNIRPGIKITPVHTGLNSPLQVPETENPRIFCIFGGQPGKMENGRDERLMESVRSCMRPGDILLVGFDRKKQVRILEKTYNDVKGLMSAFNKNMLHVLNRITGAGTDPDEFTYRAFYDPGHSRIEMHLQALTDLNLHLRKAGLILGMCRGETIMTSTARKYDVPEFERVVSSSGLNILRLFSDELNWYSLAEVSLS